MRHCWYGWLDDSFHTTIGFWSDQIMPTVKALYSWALWDENLSATLCRAKPFSLITSVLLSIAFKLDASLFDATANHGAISSPTLPLMFKLFTAQCHFMFFHCFILIKWALIHYTNSLKITSITEVGANQLIRMLNTIWWKTEFI